MDDTATIKILRDKAIAFRDARNWAQFHDPKNLAMGLSIEAAELQELFLWKTKEEVAGYLDTEKGRGRVREELADVLIYLLYLSDACGVDLSDAVMAKLELNERKYPVEKAMNSHKKYDEL